MGFKEIYAAISEKDNIENKDKKIISDDAAAICEQLEKLVIILGVNK